jgi:drug/metabolite transporter (DMT)-like permease
VALFVAMCVIWGVPYLLIRVAVRDISPAAVVFMRTALGALVLVPFAVRQGGGRRMLARWRPLLAYSVVEVAIPWWLLTGAEQHLTSALAGLLIAAVPLLGLVLTRLTPDPEPVDAMRLAGLLVGVLGVGALVGLQFGHIDLLAVGAVLLTALGYASGPLVLTRYLADLPPVGVVVTSLVVGAVASGPAAALSWPSRVSGEAAASIVTLAIVCTATAFLVFFALVAEVGPTRATVITYVNPAVAIALGVTVLGEHFTTGMAIGFPLVLLGSVLAARTRRPVALPAQPAGAAASSLSSGTTSVSTISCTSSPGSADAIAQ